MGERVCVKSANGMMMWIPIEKLEQWEKEQDEIRDKIKSTPIKRVLEITRKDDTHANSLFLFSPTQELHITNGCWFALQTEHGYIVMGAEGISYSEKLWGFPITEFFIEDFDDEKESVTSVEAMFFVGERLHDVEEEDGYYTLKFDSFQLRIFPHTEDKFPTFLKQAIDKPIQGLDRHIKRKCGCSGSAEIMFDFVADFYIRCSECHSSTYADWDLKRVIDQWNKGETPIKVKTDEEDFFEHSHEPINYIAVCEVLQKYDENLLDCRAIVVAMKDRFYRIKTIPCYDDVGLDFTFERLHKIDTTGWDYRIVATEKTPISFVNQEKSPDTYPGLIFRFGEKPILVTALEWDAMTVGLSHWDDNDFCKQEVDEGLFQK